MALFAEGKLFKEAGTGSGGGDQHNLGYYATQAALEEAHPTAEAGDWAIVGATDTVWIWDTDNSEWVDSDTKGQVTSVNGQTGDVVLDLLPTQTGQSGKFLTTDGTDASWSDKAVVNNATGNYSIAIGDGSVCEANNSVAIGERTRAVGSYNVAIGSMAGNSSSTGQAGQMQVAIGYFAKTRAYGAIQLGLGTNSNANTFKVGNDNGNFEMMSADGTIPADRLVHAINWHSTMPTAGADNLDDIIQFTGETDANYTNGYFYKCVVDSTTPASATIAQTTGSTLSDLTVDATTCWGTLGDYSIPQQTGDYVFTYNDGMGLWDYDDRGSFDLAEFGVAYTGTPADGDVLTISVTAPSTTYAWTRVDVQPAPEALPDQTGQSGKFLTTDGTDASWSDKPLVNKATGTDSLSLIGNGSTSNYAINIGSSSIAGSYCIAIGKIANVQANDSIGIGNYTMFQHPADTYSVAIGYRASIGKPNAIQINVSGNVAQNDVANTFKVANQNGNYEIMSADGTVPTARLTKVNTTATLAVADWSSNTQTVTVNGVKADSVVFVSPAPASASDYASAGILCTAQAANSLTFTCTTTPTNAITVNVVCM